jgi:hypothetical protein
MARIAEGDSVTILAGSLAGRSGRVLRLVETGNLAYVIVDAFGDLPHIVLITDLVLNTDLGGSDGGESGDRFPRRPSPTSGAAGMALSEDEGE